MKHEGKIESIRTRLLNLSRANGETFDYVLARYGIERVLYRFSGDFQPTYSHRAVLRPIPKSIGMFSYTDTILEPLCVMPGVRCYRARHHEHQFQVMAVWTSVSARGRSAEALTQTPPGWWSV
jgi:hypothetical protein